LARRFALKNNKYLSTATDAEKPIATERQPGKVGRRNASLLEDAAPHVGGTLDGERRAEQNRESATEGVTATATTEREAGGEQPCGDGGWCARRRAREAGGEQPRDDGGWVRSPAEGGERRATARRRRVGAARWREAGRKNNRAGGARRWRYGGDPRSGFI
jgi:hypothetical protein